MNLPELKNLIAAKTGSDPKPSGEGFICRCPAHDDKNASLSINEGRDGLLLKCHAGCDFNAIAAELGIKPKELFYESATAGNGKIAKDGKFNIVATYPYRDAEGNLLFEVCRLDPKGFCQRQPDPATPGKWLWNLKGVKLIPYRLPELITAVKSGESVFVVEGEKDVAALVKNGFVATCNAAGAGKWQDNFANYFEGAKAVCIIADKDNQRKSAENSRKEAEISVETPVFRSFPAEIPVKPLVAMPVPANSALVATKIPASTKPTTTNHQENYRKAAEIVVKTLGFRPIPAEIPAIKSITQTLPQQIKKTFVTREHLAEIFQHGARPLSRSAAVTALKMLGFGKTAAYEALLEDGRFSAWLKFAPDGMISWNS